MHWCCPGAGGAEIASCLGEGQTVLRPRLDSRTTLAHAYKAHEVDMHHSHGG